MEIISADVEDHHITFLMSRRPHLVSSVHVYSMKIEMSNRCNNFPLIPEAMVGRLETLARLLHAVGRHTTRPEELYSEIRLMYQDLTRVGPQLEATYPG